mmetsp:Transcript_55956/g.130784  ORF Transcript_55956/g.130784 Transcript_55956/m.130784 type:complete len:360 (+) Transcript_55956:42-1121(+)
MAATFDAAIAGLSELDVKSTIINGNGVTPRFDVFHFEWSICSWKVRCVLMEKGIPWTSWLMTAPKHNNYDPAYVRVRALGNPGGSLVGEVFTGSTSVASQGFDPLVVPTLVDRQKKKVIIDSKVICEYIEKEVPQPVLMPPEFAVTIAKHMDLVDETPHMGMLYGIHLADTPQDPVIASFAVIMKTSHEGQLKSLESYLADQTFPADLRPLYEAKMKKTRLAMKNVGVGCTKADVNRLHDAAKRILSQLEEELNQSRGPFICGATYTMADLVWFVSFLRLFELGYESWFSKEVLPLTHEYSKRILRQPTLAQATYLWPYKPVSGNVRKLMQETRPLQAIALNYASWIMLSLAACKMRCF